MNKESPEFMGNSEDDMSVTTVKKFFRKSMSPYVSMFFPAARAGFAFTGERDNLGDSAVRADESSKAAIFSAASKHFFGFMDNIFRELILVELFEKSPVIISFKNRFKGEPCVHNRYYIRKV